MHFLNIENDETVYQRCVLLRGRLDENAGPLSDHVCVKVTDSMGDSVSHVWPVTTSLFKALIMLSPGMNQVDIGALNFASTTTFKKTLNLNYVPLLQLPPLHLAIMIAKDSPLQVDCPSWKGAGITSAHTGLDSVISKFRTTAYMWQALTAEDMHSKGLGRRSFRLDEEWAIDTISASSMRKRGDKSKLMRPMAKVHLVRSEKTLAELLDKDVAQQNQSARRRDDLHKYFENALKAQGGIFGSFTRPIIAGLILDSHFDLDENLLLGHAALGCHNPNGMSLGVFGSHLTYSWPRFFAEIPASLLDTTPPGDTVCNDNGQCGTAWEACSIGQGAFLHEVGHAFGAPHTSGIMARGYAQHWPRNFISGTAYCDADKTEGILVVDGKVPNDARWSLKDALSFRVLPHFRIPGDVVYSASDARATPTVRPAFEEEGDSDSKLIIECPVGITSIEIPGLPIPIDDVIGTETRIEVSLAALSHDTAVPIYVLGTNGREYRYHNVWKLFKRRAIIRVPGTDILLRKTEVGYKNDDDDDENERDDDDSNTIDWAFLLNEKGPKGNLTRATAVDLRVGCIMDGAVVHYADGHTTNCGPSHRDGRIHTFGGHASEKIHIPEGVDIAKVRINRTGGWNCLNGIRMTLTDGTSAGELNNRSYSYDESDSEDEDDDHEIETLEPMDGEKIVGLCGRSQAHGGGYCMRFGIITAPKDVELPSQVYEMSELRNHDSREA